MDQDKHIHVYMLWQTNEATKDLMGPQHRATALDPGAGLSS